MWRKLASFSTAAREYIIAQNTEIIDLQQRTEAKATSTAEQLHEVHADVQQLEKTLTEFVSFAQTVWRDVYDKLLDVRPPSEHVIDDEVYPNPFALARAEDFNHNYSKLAKLFQESPDWYAIQDRTNNLILEGGRGTGKSTILRRLTVQASVAAARLSKPDATFDSLQVDYFGIYAKITRGYHDQQLPLLSGSDAAVSLLAQQELNLAIFDSFVEALIWVQSQHALGALDAVAPTLIKDLNSLFPKAPVVHTFQELKNVVCGFEQDQINEYHRVVAFPKHDGVYGGSATNSVQFVRRLSELFRRHLFPTREIRLLLLIDEFEALTEIQQVAVNTIIKMRLPDLTVKLAVRVTGRKTARTFTPGDPIQKPRDFTLLPLDYDITETAYSDLLHNIAAKRLADAGYKSTNIEDYLAARPITEEASEQAINEELTELWSAGNRRTEKPPKDFREKYLYTAVYRALARGNRRKSYTGFPMFVLLSSGVINSFIELCKFAFYLALTDGLPLRTNPSVPHYLQTEAALAVSQRLFDAIDANVEIYGPNLKILLAYLGRVLRERMLRHSSEPEVIRFTVPDYVPSTSSMSTGALILDSGVEWSVFQLKTITRSFLPRNPSVTPAVELVINRIYCPALRIPPRDRWRVRIALQEFDLLAEPARREAAYRKLMKRIGLKDVGDEDRFEQEHFGFDAEV